MSDHGRVPTHDWEAHSGFKEQTQNWLGAHQMFRRLSKFVRTETELFLDKSRAPENFAGRLSHYGNALVQNLHGHHGWEDHSYFPELSAADPHFDAGLENLEKNREALDIVLSSFTETVNRTIKLIQLDENQARDEAGNLHGVPVWFGQVSPDRSCHRKGILVHPGACFIISKKAAHPREEVASAPQVSVHGQPCLKTF